MANYISSNANRFYAALESVFGQVAPIASANRFAAHRLEANQSFELSRRPDKTGSRTYLGQSAPARRLTAFAVKTYLSSWSGSGQPAYGPLFQAAMGGAVEHGFGKTIAASVGRQLQTTTPHGFAIGSAVSVAGEIRFVSAVVDSQTCLLNAPFTKQPAAGGALAPTATYRLASALPSVTLYDCWDPITAVSRIAVGTGVDRMTLSVNGDYHDFTFSGPAADLLDSRTFAAGDGGLAQFPVEPALTTFDAAGVPGHLGQAWIGDSGTETLTLTEAQIQLNNNLQTRSKEFGSLTPTAIVPGEREISTSFTLIAQDDASTVQIYAAAKKRIPIQVMLQLGLQQGRLLGIYLPAVTPEQPGFDDAEVRLKWKFSNNLAQGINDDEIYLAFA